MKKILKFTTLAICILFICTTCTKEDKFYAVIGKGYVLFLDNSPVQGFLVNVRAYDRENNLISYENYYTDKNGYFQVPFLKSRPKRNAIPTPSYGTTHSYSIEYQGNFGRQNYSEVVLPVEDVKSAKGTIVFDTVFIR